MPPDEPNTDLDSRIDRAVGRAVESLRSELLGRLEETRREMRSLATGEAAPPEPVPPPAAEASELELLLEAVARIDTARSQADILEALLEGGCRFASRTAFLLARPEGLRGWRAHGFGAGGTAIDGLEIGYLEDTAWARLAEGGGSIALEPGEGSELWSPLDGEEPAEGVLIPMVLRDQLAGGLYADRVAADGLLQPRALALLTYVAGQALETLPLRERPATPTLYRSGEAPAGLPSLPLFGSDVTVAAEVEVEEPPALAEPVVEEPAVEEPAVEELLEVEFPPAAPTAPPPAPAVEELAAVDEVGFAVEPAAPEPAPPEPPMVPPAEPAAVSPPLEAPAPISPPAAPLESPAVVEPPAPEPAVAPPPVTETPAPEPPVPVPPAPPPPLVAPPPAEAPAYEEEEDTRPGLAEPAPVRDSAEVIPPADVQGPGWAFTGAPDRGRADVEESRHEDARRLARLLVTEIKLYNEEQVEEGRRKRNVYRALREDIDRSRQIYEERVEESVRDGTDYFREELVRILADGDEGALGA